jgi:hypothetical protein
MIQRKEIKSEIEKTILIGLIVSDEFNRAIIDVVRGDYFDSPFAEKLLFWLREYKKVYESAPKRDIQTIFHAKKEILNDRESEAMELFLGHLSDHFEENATNDWKYQIDIARTFCEKKALTFLAEDVKYFTDLGDLSSAKNLITNFHSVSRELSQADDFFGNTQGIIESLIPMDLESVESLQNVAMTLPGAVGDLLGPLQKGWLVSVISGAKAGKTLEMMEFAVQGVMQRKKVLFLIMMRSFLII